MKNSWKIGILAVAVLAAVGTVYGATFKIATQASSPAFIVANNGTSTVTIAITGAGTGAVVTVDGNANTWADTLATEYTNAADFATALEKSTNASGQAVLTVNRYASLPTDTVAGKLTNATYSLLAGSTTNAIYWDSPAALHYDCFGKADYQPLVIDNIFGNPGGTGNITLSIYVNSVLAWQTLLTPGYTLANDANTNIVVTATGLVGLPIPVNLPIESGKSFFIRAARATTLTTGNIGAVLKPQE